MEDSGYSPSAVIINPLTWHATRTSKAAPSGEYLAGSWNVPASPNLWNMAVVTTGAIPIGEALVIDTSCVLLLDREEPTVLISTEDRDNFVKNVVTILAEVRLALAVLDTGGVRKLDLID